MNSCDEAEPIPSYIYISSIGLEVEPGGSQGSNAEDIVDAWVYVNSQLIGAFEMPATIPILKEGKQQLTVIAGIKKNGLITERVRYPFYKAYDIDHTFIPSQVDTIKPVVKYNDNTKFVWMEDFEDNTISMQKSGSNTTVDTLHITENPADVFEYDGTSNKRSGEVKMPTGFQIFENGTITNYDLPRSGQEVYLEFNFRCNTEFVAGFYPINSNTVTGVPVVNYFSTVDGNGVMQWKKAYVSLKEDINFAAYQSADIRVFFNAQTNNPSEESLIYFDNIKLIHF